MKSIITVIALLVASCATSPAMQAALDHQKAAIGCEVTLSGFVAAAKACDDKSCALRAQVGYEAAKAACAVTLSRLEAKAKAAAKLEGGS